MPLVQSLDILRVAALRNPVFKAVLDDVHEKVRGGTALSDAFAAHGDLFPAVYTASLMAGERAGNLDAVLRRFVAYSKVVDTVRIEDHLGAGLSGDPDHAGASCWSASSSSRWCRRSRSSTAASTPSCRSRRASSSRISDFVRAQMLLIIVAVGSAPPSRSTTWIKQPGQGRGSIGWMLKLPVIGASVHKFATSQLARTLATLLGGGIPLVNALEIAARSTGNRHMGRELEIVAQRVREGQGFAATLLERQAVPDVAIKMIEVGESTGALTGNAEQPRRLLRRGDRNRSRRGSSR